MERHRNKMEKIKETEWAYLAAFIDADGSIGAGKYKKNGKTLRPVIQVEQKDPLVLYWIVSRFGGNFYKNISHKQGYNKDYHGYKWILSSKSGCNWILEHIIPYLICKKEKAKEVLSYCEYLTNEEKGRIAYELSRSRQRDAYGRFAGVCD